MMFRSIKDIGSSSCLGFYSFCSRHNKGLVVFTNFWEWWMVVVMANTANAVVVEKDTADNTLPLTAAPWADVGDNKATGEKTDGVENTTGEEAVLAPACLCGRAYCMTVASKPERGHRSVLLFAILLTHPISPFWLTSPCYNVFILHLVWKFRHG